MSTVIDDRSEGGPLVPDAVTADQFFGSLTQHSKLTGERRLMIAVLEDGINCFLKLGGATDPKRRQVFLEAQAWIASTSRADLCTFENVCLALDLDPDYIREGLLARRASPAAAERESARTACERASADGPGAIRQAC